MARFFANLDPCLIGMEVCGSANHWARRLQGFGHTVKLISPQLAEKGVCVKIFDNENEYKTLLKKTGPGNVYIFDTQKDKDNFLEPPAGISPKEWLAKLKNLIREVFYLRDGSMNLLHTLLHDLFASRGIFEGGDDYPTILDLIAVLKTRE